MTDRNVFSQSRKQTPETHFDLNLSKIPEHQNSEESFRELSSHNPFASRSLPVPKAPQINFFDASQIRNRDNPSDDFEDEFANEPSLLEELDIDIESVKSKLKSTLFFFRPNPEFAKKPDLVGPLVLATILGFTLVLVI